MISQTNEMISLPLIYSDSRSADGMTTLPVTRARSFAVMGSSCVTSSPVSWHCHLSHIALKTGWALRWTAIHPSVSLLRNQLFPILHKTLSLLSKSQGQMFLPMFYLLPQTNVWPRSCGLSVPLSQHILMFHGIPSLYCTY